MNTRNQKQYGFSLLEILITLIVLSIGLLGMAGLQGASLRANHGSYLRSQATMMAGDLLDRMRANHLTASAGGYDISFGALGAAPNDCQSVGVDCTPLQTAQYDLQQWKNHLSTTLPAGDGAIRRDGELFIIEVQWDDTRGQEAPTIFAIQTEL
ncbi:MAG: type IV pilus modification protein PilV [Magnetococcus sp. DMHC-6]